MRILTDTHVMLWWMADDPRLSGRARELLGQPGTDLCWSIASSWELAIKVAAGKLRLTRGLERFVADVISDQRATLVPITQGHCMRVATLPMHHRDPFDRMLVAQAQDLGVPLLSADLKLAAYDVDVVW